MILSGTGPSRWPAIGWERETPAPNHRFTDYLESRGGRLFFDGLDLAGLFLDGGNGGAREAMPSPLEFAYLPMVRRRIGELRGAFQTAIQELGYSGAFHFAYASKANTTEEVVRTTLAAGAHYEMSSRVDVEIARLMSRTGHLPAERMVLANGFKGPGTGYLESLLEFRHEHAKLLPILEDLNELPPFVDSALPFQVGLRQKSYGLHRTPAEMEAANSRFGLNTADLRQAAEIIAASPNLELCLYHAMIGTQLTDVDEFVDGLRPAIESYACLRTAHPSLRMFDFGGGMPAAMTLDFDFDYHRFCRQLLQTFKVTCSRYGVPEPDIVGELGRYTSAEHGAHFFKVIATKDNGSGHPWYVLDGSIMTSFPDIWALGEHFVVLPLNHLDRPFQRVQLGGITCDSDDIYPPRGSRAPLYLPRESRDLYVGFFGVGAYQEMLGGPRKSKHCVLPEASELIVDRAASSAGFEFKLLPGHTTLDVLANLGYAVG